MNILKRIKNKLIKISFQFKGKTRTETISQHKLLLAIKQLDCNTIECENTWAKYRRHLRLCILRNDARNFLRWDPVLGSMFHNANPIELEHLIKQNKDLWLPALQETHPVGNPPQYKHYKNSNGNLIHTAYNLSQLLEHCDINLAKMHSVVEFGAGYGCMAKLICDMGFTGTYIIYDIPEFLALQQYYLTTSGSRGNFDFVNQSKDLHIQNPDIFIATWSLSESPLDLRNSFLRKIGGPKYILIAYQEKFGEVANQQYFAELKKDRPNYIWTEHEIPHLPGNFYLIGKKNCL